MKHVVKLIVSISLVICLAGIIRAAEPKPAAPLDKKDAKETPSIEVVFVLDTTGSMGGLIQAAKDKIWAIANTLASAESAPEIKLGLVAYRDRRDDYITKLVEITPDLDKVYSELMKFRAMGGGDGPESVNQALHEAVTKLKWSTGDKTYRVIFLVGDAPPHMDYSGDVRYPEVCRAALEKGIVINTIQCGRDPKTTEVWQNIARKGEGSFFRVSQSGSAVRTTTPFDAELAKLSRELDRTRVYYGAENKRKAAVKSDADFATSPVSESVRASRAAFKSTESAKKARMSPDSGRGIGDLVDKMEEESFELEKVEEKELPEKMQKMKPEERKEYLEEQRRKRTEITAKIKELSAKRQAHIKKELEKKKGKTTLDDELYKCIKKQAAKKDIIYKNGPKY